MSEQRVYAHKWYSQPERSIVVGDRRLRRAETVDPIRSRPHLASGNLLTSKSTSAKYKRLKHVSRRHNSPNASIGHKGQQQAVQDSEILGSSSHTSCNLQESTSFDNGSRPVEASSPQIVSRIDSANTTESHIVKPVLSSENIRVGNSFFYPNMLDVFLDTIRSSDTNLPTRTFTIDALRERSCYSSNQALTGTTTSYPHSLSMPRSSGGLYELPADTGRSLTSIAPSSTSRINRVSHEPVVAYPTTKSMLGLPITLAHHQTRSQGEKASRQDKRPVQESSNATQTILPRHKKMSLTNPVTDSFHTGMISEVTGVDEIDVATISCTTQPSEQFLLRPKKVVKDGQRHLLATEKALHMHDEPAVQGANRDNFYTPENQDFYANGPYEKLERRYQEIRLLRVYPKRACSEHYKIHPQWNSACISKLDSACDVLACEMEETSLTRISDNYVTLSYRAGDPKQTAVILVNGLPFKAFANLEHAIEQAEAHWSREHPERGPLLLWADQICINQSDNQERSEQVQMMRDIYRRSSETYICLSDPTRGDHLSWVPLTLPSINNDFVSSQPPDIVIKMKQILLDLLMGQDKGAMLRTILASQSSRDGQPPRNSFNNITTSGFTASSFGGSQSSLFTQGSQQQSADRFQSSIVAFVANKWWQRSWVLQEFLSASSIHFISGYVSVPWRSLSPLVEFICDDLGNFLEQIRRHFEDHVTDEMEQQYQAEKRSERARIQEEQRREQEREQQRLVAEAKKQREEDQANQQRQADAEREKRELEERKEVQKRSRNLMDLYNLEMDFYEAERLRQWSAAFQKQERQRANFATEQRTIVQQELESLHEQKAATNVLRNPQRLPELRRKLKELRCFKEEIAKPISEQIQRAKNIAEGRSTGTLNRQCGGRLSEPYRVAMLLRLDEVAQSPEDFVPDSVVPPIKPIYPCVSNVITTGTAQTWPKGSSQYQPQVIPTRHSTKPRLQQTEATKTLLNHGQSSANPLSNNNGGDIAIPDQDTFVDASSGFCTEDWALKRPDIHEIRQRDQIIHVQDVFRSLDKSAIASMTRAKKDFRRYSDITSLLQHSRSCVASDSRDKVYAFLGLAEPKYNIVPNYEASNRIEQVLIDTAKSIIINDSSLDILQHVHRGRDNLGIRLPSWVPDWTSKEIVRGIDEHIWGNETPFRAGGPHAHVEFLQDENSAILKTQAVYVDRVENILSPNLRHVSTVNLSKGDWAFVPQAVRLDDEIWILYGAARPAVLRRDGEDRFGYLGDALICTGTVTSQDPTFATIMYGLQADKAQDQLDPVNICII